MIPAVKSAGMAALFGGIVIGGIVHFMLGFFINKIRHWLPPLVTGLIVLTIGLTLLPVGIKYAAGINILSDVTWIRRNMVIFALSLSIGLGLQAVPEALDYYQ